MAYTKYNILTVDFKKFPTFNEKFISMGMHTYYSYVDISTSGGIKTVLGDEYIYKFTSDASIYIGSDIDASILVVGGGGSGITGGGGGGEFVLVDASLLAGWYAVQVGQSDCSSYFNGILAKNGLQSVYTGFPYYYNPGGNSGSGKFGGKGQMYGTLIKGGGGGGHTANGIDGSIGGTGGSGISSDISGTIVQYCGGGGGGRQDSSLALGKDGGGNGGNMISFQGKDASPNTGGGGGGATPIYSSVYGKGGTGVVILRFKYKF